MKNTDHKANETLDWFQTLDGIQPKPFFHTRVRKSIQIEQKERILLNKCIYIIAAASLILIGNTLFFLKVEIPKIQENDDLVFTQKIYNKVFDPDMYYDL